MADYRCITRYHNNYIVEEFIIMIIPSIYIKEYLYVQEINSAVKYFIPSRRLNHLCHIIKLYLGNKITDSSCYIKMYLISDIILSLIQSATTAKCLNFLCKIPLYINCICGRYCKVSLFHMKIIFQNMFLNLSHIKQRSAIFFKGKCFSALQGI